MKTAEIKDLLKKELLLVELPEDTQFDVLVDNPLWKDGIKFLTGTDEKFHFIKGSYTLLGKSSEISEDDAKELVESWESVANDGTIVYENYKNSIPKKSTALESFHSALESEIYWDVNPIKHPKDYSLAHQSLNWYTDQEKKFNEAELRTFDRSRSIILVKN